MNQIVLSIRTENNVIPFGKMYKKIEAKLNLTKLLNQL